MACPIKRKGFFSYSFFFLQSLQKLAENKAFRQLVSKSHAHQYVKKSTAILLYIYNVCRNLIYVLMRCESSTTTVNAIDPSENSMRQLQSIFFSLKARLSSILENPHAKKLFQASESPAGFMAIVGLVMIAVIVAQLDFSSDDTPVSNTSETGTENDLQETAAVEPSSDTQPAEAAIPQQVSEQLTLKRRETLIELLRRNNFSSSSAHAAVLALGKVANMRRLQAGQKFSVTRIADDEETIDALWFRESFGQEAHVKLNEDGRYTSENKPVMTANITELVEGTIEDNLYLSAKQAGLPDGVIIELIRMLSFDVDFEREIRRGDTFSVYYERQYAPAYGDKKNGNILHVDLGLKRNPVSATLFEASDGTRDYFRPDGKSTRRTLMKTPLDVAVVTSRYGSRKHPVLGYTRMHKGVDFRAPTGTPIMAAGDGVVERASRNGSYGNYVRIRHNDNYKTAYAHLSRYAKGVKKGRRVKQGQIIGYSGATGRVTAAHLHYEVLYNGKQTNPLTLKLPTGKTLKGEDLVRFKERYGILVADIDKARENGPTLAGAQAPGTQAAR